MQEEWRYIKDYPNYMVSNLGNVKSLNHRRTGREHLLKQTTNNDGYKLVVLHNDNGTKTITVHKLVALTFLNKYEDNLEINHIDNNRSNNIVSNLEWTTHQENIKQRDLTYKPKINNTIKPDEVLLIRKKRQNGEKCKDLYKSYANRITFNGFEKIYYGITWKNLN